MSLKISVIFSVQLIVVASCYGVKEKTIQAIRQSCMYKIITRWRHPVGPAQENIELGHGQQAGNQNTAIPSSNQVKN